MGAALAVATAIGSLASGAASLVGAFKKKKEATPEIPTLPTEEKNSLKYVKKLVKGEVFL